MFCIFILMKLFKVTLLAFLFISSKINAQMVLDLYGTNANNSVVPNAIPCSEKEVYTKNNNHGTISHVTHPTLKVFLPATANTARSAVIICPGGGYSVLAIDHEGDDVAKALNAMGIAAFVLKYRIPDAKCMEHPENVPLMDAQRALKIVRDSASKYNIDPSKIGVMGFSAGGHLASSLGTHFNEKILTNAGNTSLRPDFMVLLYPVISFNQSIAHMGSRQNLVGKNATEELVHRFSNEEQITAQTPPAFLVHAVDDNVVPVANSIVFLEALHKNKVAAEMHLYQGGGHGFGLHNPTTKDDWTERLKNWFYTNGFLK